MVITPSVCQNRADDPKKCIEINIVFVLIHLNVPSESNEAKLILFSKQINAGIMLVEIFIC